MSPSHAAISLLSGVLLGSPLTPVALPAVSPRSGGVLHIEFSAKSFELDPRQWRPGSIETGANQKLAALIFDRLVSLDNYGHFQPSLAVRWSDDGGLYRRWQFTIRSGVKFSDGTLLTAADVAAALQPLLPAADQVSASADMLVIQSSTPVPDLLEQLAFGPFFIYRALPGGALVGTGPFILDQTPASTREKAPASSKTSSPADSDPRAAPDATHLRFSANEDAWAGRPFVNAVEITLGVPPLRAMLDLQLGKADVVELAPDLVRRATQDNLRVWASSPMILYALQFNDSQPAASDPLLREALSLALDRGTMANVLLQKQAEPASALLPQWLSGYAFLFNVDTNITRAKEIRAALPLALAAGSEPLRLRVEATGGLARLLAERVAINARQASIPVQVENRPPQGSASVTNANAAPPAGIQLFAWHYSSLSPRAELDSLAAAKQLLEPAAKENSFPGADLQELYARERQILEDRRILPLVTMPEYVGIGSAVHDWMPARWGEWRLADVWLDPPKVPSARPDASKRPNVEMRSSPTPQVAVPGARP